MLFVSKNRGFTLIELAIVVAIVGVLAAVSIPIFDSFSDASKIDELHSNMLIAAEAQEKFFLEKGRYGTTLIDKTKLKKFNFPEDTEDMQFSSGVVLKKGVGQGYWISGIRKIKGELHCWLYTSSFMSNDNAASFKEFKPGDSTFKGASCQWN